MEFKQNIDFFVCFISVSGFLNNTDVLTSALEVKAINKRDSVSKCYVKVPSS